MRYMNDMCCNCSPLHHVMAAVLLEPGGESREHGLLRIIQTGVLSVLPVGEMLRETRQQGPGEQGKGLWRLTALLIPAART